MFASSVVLAKTKEFMHVSTAYSNI